MQYPSYDYETESDDAPWTAAPYASNNTRADNSNAQLMPLTPNPLTPASAAPDANALALGAALQAMQQTQLQQMYVLRAMDLRLARLEETMASARVTATQTAPASDSFERATWWALWGLLMLILGGALAVIIVLILLNAQIL